MHSGGALHAGQQVCTVHCNCNPTAAWLRERSTSRVLRKRIKEVDPVSAETRTACIEGLHQQVQRKCCEETLAMFAALGKAIGV